MSKLLIKVNKPSDFSFIADGYIIGINDFSINFGITYSIDMIKNIINKFKNKEIYLSFNRPIYNNEIPQYKKRLKEVDLLGLTGIIFNDVSTLTYGLKTKLILSQDHLNNNYKTINHYYKNGTLGAFLTNDITLDEINEIKANSKALLFKQVFGLEHLSMSVRKLISNYLEHLNLNKRISTTYIQEKVGDKKYFMIEDYFGTHVFNGVPLNLFSYLDNLMVDYLIIDGYLLDEDKYKNVPELFYNHKDMTLDEKNFSNKKINELFNATDGFINQKTIYRVKKDD